MKLSERSKRLMRRARSEARNRGCSEVGTEHILLGIVQGDDLAGGVLEMLGLTPEQITAKVNYIVGEPVGKEAE